MATVGVKGLNIWLERSRGVESSWVCVHTMLPLIVGIIPGSRIQRQRDRLMTTGALSDAKLLKLNDLSNFSLATDTRHLNKHASLSAVYQSQLTLQFNLR